MLLSIPGEMIHTLRPEELAGDVESFAADYHDLLTIEQLLSHGAGQATKEVPFAIDNSLSTTVEAQVSFPLSCFLIYARSFVATGRGIVATYDWIKGRHPGLLLLIVELDRKECWRWSSTFVW